MIRAGAAMIKINKLDPKTYGVQPQLLEKFAKNMDKDKFDEALFRKLMTQAVTYVNTLEYWMQDANPMFFMNMVEGVHAARAVSGPYGLCATNPVCVADVTGELQFLSRLTRTGGADFQDRIIFHRLGSMPGAPDNHMVDCFEVCSPSGDFYTRIFLDLYHYVVPPEDTPIEGFFPKLLPVCGQISGITAYLENFPEGLPETAFRYSLRRYGFPYLAAQDLINLDVPALRKFCKKMRAEWTPPEVEGVVH